MILVNIQNISKTYMENKIAYNALSGITLEIPNGGFIALSGPSGSGKTTLLNLIGCLDRPSSGSIFFGTDEVSRLPQKDLTNVRLKKIGFVFQDYNLIPTFSALENVEYILWLQGVEEGERRRRSLEALQRFGMEKLSHRRPAQLSRGQQQRVAVSRAIVHKPQILLGDELTANLDHKTAAELMHFLTRLNEDDGTTFVYATHDPEMVAMAHQVVLIRDGKRVG